MNIFSRRPRLLICAAGCAGLLTMGQAPAFAQVAPIVAAPTAAGASPAPAAVSSRPPVNPVNDVLDVSNGQSSNIFTALLGDFRNLASRDSARWLGIGASIALVGHVGDHQVSRALGSQSLHEAFESGQVLGGAPVQLGGAFAAYAVGRMAGSSRTAEVGAELFRAQVVAQTMTSLMKVSSRRSRPDGQPFSFPSGHTASAFASATVLQRNFGWKAGIPAYAIASYVAASRIQTERHYLSDVAFGAALGILAGRTATVGTSHARLAVAPFAVAGGGGIGFSLVPSH